MEEGVEIQLPVKELEVIYPHGYRYVKRKMMGDIEIVLPDPPENLSDILNYDKPQKEQRFEYHKFKDYQEFKKLPSDERVAYLDLIWGWRRKGLFFLNNGNLEYLTGIHWFVLNCIIDNGERLVWIDSDRDFWHLWQWVEKNPTCLGLVYSTHRREGKTVKGYSILLEFASSEYFKRCAIQSKTLEDSSEYFQRLVYSWTKLPVYFKPIHTGVKNPKTELVFAEPSTRKVNNNDFEYYKVLNSLIDYKSSKEKAYDGVKLHRGLFDEEGKTVEANVYKRWEVNRPCFMDGLTKVIGKSLHSTTVESEDGESRTGKNKGLGQSVENFKKIWDGSDIKQLDDNGMTKTGLVRYFKSSIYGMRDFVDEYGYSDPIAANTFIENTLAKLDGEEALAFRRKYPRSEEDMWGTMDTDNGLDLNKILQQKEWNKTHVNNTDESNIKLQRGDFYWKNQFGGAVEWIPNPNGKFKVVWLPKFQDTNQWFWKNGVRYPKNYLEGVIGVDPIDDTVNNIDKPSDFALATYRIGGLAESMFNNAFVNVYCTRSTYPETHFEDALKCAIFYGYQICIEDNRTSFKNWLRERGFIGYLTPRPVETAPDSKILTELDFGIPTTNPRVRDLLFNYLAVYVFEHCGFDKSGAVGNVYIDDILNDWIKYKPSQKWTKYDLTVATLMALGGAKGSSNFRQPESTPVVLDVPVYSIKGERSVIVRK